MAIDALSDGAQGARLGSHAPIRWRNLTHFSTDPGTRGFRMFIISET